MNEMYKILCALGIVQSLFLAAVLLARKNNRKANRFTALIMFFTAIDLVEVYLSSGGFYDSLPVYPLSIVPYSYIFGPAVLCYSIFAISQKGLSTKKILLIFAPSAIVLVINLFLFFHTGIPGSILHLTRPEKISLNLKIVTAGAVYESLMYIMAFYCLNRYVHRLHEFFSDIARMQMLWLRIVIIAIFIVELGVAITYRSTGGLKYEPGIAEVIIMLIGLVFIFSIAFLAIIQPEFLSEISIMDSSLPAGSKDLPKYEKLRLSPSTEKQYVADLKNLMQNEKPHLREDLTLQDIAQSLSIGTHQLSMILNVHMQINFYNFINSYRVDEAKALLSNPGNSNASILSIAYRSGFNSKTTFNSMFKKITGMTPTQYRASL